MTNTQRLATVRARLKQWLADHCQAGDENPSLAESILIRDGFFCGRRFDAGSHQAVWFMEEDELKIYSDGGELQSVMNSSQISEPTEATATGDQPTDESQPAGDPDIIKLPVVTDNEDATDDEGEIRRAA